MVVVGIRRECNVGTLLVVAAVGTICVTLYMAFSSSASNPTSVLSEFNVASPAHTKRESILSVPVFACPATSPSEQQGGGILVPINASEWCPDIVWLQPLLVSDNPPNGTMPASQTTHPSMLQCVGLCLENECCVAFGLLWALPNVLFCNVTRVDRSFASPLPPLRVRGMREQRWQLVGQRDWSYSVPTARTGQRLRTVAGPHRFVVPSPSTGRWRGSALELQIVDADANLIMSAGGVRIRLINSSANAVLEEVESDVEHGAVHSALQSTLPSVVARPIDYLVEVLFAPLHRSPRFPESVWIKIPFTVMPAVVGLNLLAAPHSLVARGCVQLITMDLRGAPSWNSGDGIDLAAMWYHREGTTENKALAVGPALLSRGRGFWCPLLLGELPGGRIFATMGIHTSSRIGLPRASPLRNTSHTSVVVVVSLSASSCRPNCGWRLSTHIPRLAARMFVVTCDVSGCPPVAWGASCLLVRSGCRNSQFLDHRANVQHALEVVESDANAIDFIFMEAHAAPPPPVLLDQLMAADPVYCAAHGGCGAAFCVFSPRFTTPVDLALSKWRVPEDIDGRPLEAPWWRDVIGRRWMGAWASNRSQIAFCTPCFANEMHDCAIRVFGGASAVKFLQVVDRFFDAAKDTSCYPFASLLVVLMSTLSG